MVVFPAPVPKTTPLASTWAAAGLLLVQIPPGVPLLDKLIAEPLHTEEAPLMEPAEAPALTSTG